MAGRPPILDGAGRVLAAVSDDVGTGGGVARNRPSPCRLDVDIHGTLFMSHIGPAEPRTDPEYDT